MLATRIKHYLTANKSAPLYHWMKTNKIADVFNSDALLPLFTHKIVGKPGISLSRNERFDMNTYHGGDRPIRLTLDQAKIAQTHKIVPLDAEQAVKDNTWGGEQPVKFDRHKAGKFKNEFDLMAEEYVIGAIKPLHRYILAIYLDNETNSLHWELPDYADDNNEYYIKWVTKNRQALSAIKTYVARYKPIFTVADPDKWQKFLRTTKN